MKTILTLKGDEPFPIFLHCFCDPTTRKESTCEMLQDRNKTQPLAANYQGAEGQAKRLLFVPSNHKTSLCPKTAAATKPLLHTLDIWTNPDANTHQKCSHL